MRVSCLESTEWGRCEAIEREHGGLPSEKLRQEYHQRSIEALAMPCGRLSAGPPIMTGKQPLNVITVVDVEALSGSHAM
jgi:hypothetical protein